MLRRLLLIAPLLALVACATTALFAVKPAEASVGPSGMIQLLALNAPAPVVWAVTETGGGTVSSTGVYTAPACPTTGTFHVTATSDGQVATVTITVVDHVKTITVAPVTVNLSPGGTNQFTATVTTNCGVVSTSP